MRKKGERPITPLNSWSLSKQMIALLCSEPKSGHQCGCNVRSTIVVLKQNYNGFIAAVLSLVLEHQLPSAIHLSSSNEYQDLIQGWPCLFHPLK